MRTTRLWVQRLTLCGTDAIDQQHCSLANPILLISWLITLKHSGVSRIPQIQLTHKFHLLNLLQRGVYSTLSTAGGNYHNIMATKHE